MDSFGEAWEPRWPQGSGKQEEAPSYALAAALGVQLGTSPSHPGAYTANIMQLKQIKTAVAAAWIATIGAVGFIADVAQPAAWIVLGACAVIPAAAMLHFWNPPPPTMSEEIQKALR